MSNDPQRASTPGHDRVIVQGIVVTLLGVVLGLGYNAAGLMSDPAFGIPWITEAREALEFEELVGATGGRLPVIAEAGEPVAIALDDVTALIDAGAALIVDARDPGASKNV